ncbi:MAG: hypothetical protein LBJ67_01925 [Planctomycetaceae bacterium]|jgi:hypothetical protein|nr:hypothetical protein [Planctomycetaceae bacterium]
MLRNFFAPVGDIENGRFYNFLTFTAGLTQKIVCVNDTFFIDTDGLFNVHRIFCYGKLGSSCSGKKFQMGTPQSETNQTIATRQDNSPGT